jgi:hypothetical protein
MTTLDALSARLPIADRFTNTDSTTNEWTIDDEVIQLREWGTDRAHLLPSPASVECTLGAAESCTFRIDDPSGRVSRLHARVRRQQDEWRLCDGGSKNGMRVDGARQKEVVLQPGAEIGIGGITLLAESVRSIALRDFLARLLGWTRDRIEVVDWAMRSVRMAVSRRAALVLCGADDLVPTARSLHRHARGSDRPFVVCDPRRQSTKSSVRCAENVSSGREALAASIGGTLCVRRERLPPDFPEVIKALRAPALQIQLVVCAETLDDCERYRVNPIVIPTLGGRGGEIDRIIDEYADDAMTELGTPQPSFLAEDHAWVRNHACSSHSEIEKATLRLVALRASHSLRSAAALLGMAPVSLSRWIGRRRLPLEVSS